MTCTSPIYPAGSAEYIFFEQGGDENPYVFICFLNKFSCVVNSPRMSEWARD